MEQRITVQLHVQPHKSQIDGHIVRNDLKELCRLISALNRL